MIDPINLAGELRRLFPFTAEGDLAANAAAAILAMVEESDGWPNQETSLVCLHLSNMPGWLRRAGEISVSEYPNKHAQEVAMRDFALACLRTGTSSRPGFVGDALDLFLARVVWSEVVDRFKPDF